MPDIVRLFEAEGIRLSGSAHIVRRWAAREGERLGPDAIPFLARKLIKVASKATVRNPAAFVTWATREPLGRWLPDRDLDELYRRRKCHRPAAFLRDEYLGESVGSILAGMSATIPQNGTPMEVDGHVHRL